MPRLIATSVLLSICFYLGSIQQNNSAETVIAVSMRRADKAISVSEPAHSSILSQSTHTILNVDMLFLSNNVSQCLTVSTGALAETPNVLLENCHGGDNQYWHQGTGASQWQLQRDLNYCLTTVNSRPSPGGHLTVRPCTDNRALMLLPNPNLSNSFLISDTTYVLDSDAYGYVTVAQQSGQSQQHGNWQQDNLRLSILHSD